MQIPTAAESFKKFFYSWVYKAIFVFIALVVDVQEFLHTIFDDFLEGVACSMGLVTWRGGLSACGHLEVKMPTESKCEPHFQGKVGREEQ